MNGEGSERDADASVPNNVNREQADRILAHTIAAPSLIEQANYGGRRRPVVNVFEMAPNYSTTRRLAMQKTIASCSVGSGSDCSDPDRETGKSRQGGLRTRGFFKLSTPGKPLLTVITVVFNGVKTLEMSIKSVIEQSYDNIEYIVIDGGSSDGTVDLIRKYEHEIDYWVSEKDSGIYHAMNKGIKIAAGEWVALLNADDRYSGPDSLREVATLSDDVLVAASDVLIDTDDGLKCFYMDDTRPLYKNIPYMHTGMFVRSNIYSRLGLFRTEFRIASDIDFIFRIINNNINIYRFKNPLVVMKDGGASEKCFTRGRAEYREIYVRHGGAVLLSYVGYYLSIIEKQVYRNKRCRELFRVIKGFLSK